MPLSCYMMLQCCSNFSQKYNSRSKEPRQVDYRQPSTNRKGKCRYQFVGIKLSLKNIRVLSTSRSHQFCKLMTVHQTRYRKQTNRSQHSTTKRPPCRYLPCIFNAKSKKVLMLYCSPDANPKSKTNAPKFARITYCLATLSLSAVVIFQGFRALVSSISWVRSKIVSLETSTVVPMAVTMLNLQSVLLRAGYRVI